MNKPNKILESEVLDLLDWDLLPGSSRIHAKAEDGVVTLHRRRLHLRGVPARRGRRRERERGQGGPQRVPGRPSRRGGCRYVYCGRLYRGARRNLGGPEALGERAGQPRMGHPCGQVRNHFQRMAAKLAVGAVRGVRGITDEVVISTDPIPGDVADRVDKALKRSALLDEASVA